MTYNCPRCLTVVMKPGAICDCHTRLEDAVKHRHYDCPTVGCPVQDLVVCEEELEPLRFPQGNENLHTVHYEPEVVV